MEKLQIPLRPLTIFSAVVALSTAIYLSIKHITAEHMEREIHEVLFFDDEGTNCKRHFKNKCLTGPCFFQQCPFHKLR